MQHRHPSTYTLPSGLVPAGATAFPGQMSQLGDFAAKPVDLDKSVKVHHLPTWKHRDDPTRIKTLRSIAERAGRDPRLATLAVGIVRGDAKVWGYQIPEVAPRRTVEQAARLLKWVQDKIYYVNEPGERLQDPLYTVQVGYGDCDDMALLLAALAETLRIPWKLVLSGKAPGGRTIRWVEGERRKRARWAHIYVALGDRPFGTPGRMMFAEPTIRGVPLGWDVVQATAANGRVVLPELAGVDLGDADSDAGDRAPMLAQSRRPFWEHVKGEMRDRLHPRSLVPTLLAGLVVGVLADRLRGFVFKR